MDCNLIVKFINMKTKLIVLLLLSFSIGCTQIKEDQMKNDAIKAIEYSQSPNAKSALLEMFFLSIENKYHGGDFLDFMEILRKEIVIRKEKGEDCGDLEYLF